MKNSQLTLCPNCQNILDESGHCSECGYTSNERLSPLVSGFLLKDRYIIQEVQSSNSEGFTYVGHDNDADTTVMIREYLPANLCKRNLDDGIVVVTTGREAQYKALMMDFIDLNKGIKKLHGMECIVPLLDLFGQNNTAYAVYQRIKTITLDELITRAGGKVKWEQISQSMMTLLNTLSAVHELGIIHRGLSPENILIDPSGNLWISAFCTPSARTEGSELGAQLYKGYSAPEQYSLNGWQGTWTDIYAVAAVIYRAITGIIPPLSTDREKMSRLPSAMDVDFDIPSHISDALAEAMVYDTDSRLQTVESFSGKLMGKNSMSDTCVYDTTTYVKKEPVVSEKVEKKEIKKRNRKYTIITMLVTGLILLGIAGTIFWRVYESIKKPGESSSNSLSGDTSGTGESEPLTVPNLVGSFIETVKLDKEVTDHFNLDIKEAYSEDFPTGVIFAQNPNKGETVLGEKGTITITVSKGSEMVKMPNIVGYTQELAERTMTDLGIKYEIVPVYDDSLEEGKVARTDKEVGTELSKDKDTVMIFVKAEGYESSGGSTDSSGGGDSPYTKPWWKAD
ncbi:PASTA domain-containing protein [Zongyangia hominis]|uniref:PASTA domain-containing protein n=1 Tax=Zongyangia hominis TaxID=2763677 RepID=A0A926ECS4_9FIRM|nr:PASTA domain-containing protein [Zongyangia hominis]MBC8569751.1 PASTA domain-containing protein [Zongyangia hominis]